MNIATDYDELLDEAIEIAEKAAEIAYSYFRQALLIEMKDNQTPVTIADRKTEEMIRGEISKRFPEHGIVGEEFGEEKAHADWIWTVDPIDGTRSFVRGIPLFGTLLGLVEKGEPVVGVLVLPALDEIYYGAKGVGCFCNDYQVHVSNTMNIESAFISVGDYPCFEMSGYKNHFSHLAKKAELVRGYTDCFGHSLVLRGSVDAMIDPMVSPWDVAPLACLVREAGGDYFTFEGDRSHLGKSFISCTPALREELLKLA